MAADKYSREVARTLWPWGFYKKFQDRGKFSTQEDPGLADGVFVAYGGQAAFIECKTGGKTSFAFSEWRERQREFAIACAWMNIPYWLFISIGDKVNSKDKYRCSYLISGLKVAESETQERLLYNRLSISHHTAVIDWKDYQLTWAGDSTWEIPATHPFMEVLHARSSLGSRTAGSGGDAWREPTAVHQALASIHNAFQPNHPDRPPRRIS